MSAIVLFLVLCKILPNKPQGWNQTLPGALLATVLFFVILQVLPLYLAIFGRGFQAYAAFGIFLLLMFWVYLLGIVLVLGAERNAFLEEPGRSTALAETKARPRRGRWPRSRRPAPSKRWPGAAPGPAGRSRARCLGAATPSNLRNQLAKLRHKRHPLNQLRRRVARPRLAGRLTGLVGLLGAALLLSPQQQAGEPAPRRS